MQLLVNPELQEAFHSTGGVVVGVLSSFLGDPVARAKTGAPLSVTLKWLRGKGVKVYCRRVPAGHEDLSTPQRRLANLQGATVAEERARAAAAEMDGGTPYTPATPVAVLFGKTPPAPKQDLPSVAEVVEEAEVAGDTLPARDQGPQTRAQKRAEELTKQKEKREKGKEPEQNSSDEEPPDDSGGDGDDVGDVDDGEGARPQKPRGDERRASRFGRPKASKDEGAGRGRDKDRGKGKEQRQGKKPSKSGEQKKKLLKKKLKKLKERTKKKGGGGDDDDDDSSSGDGGSSSSGDEDDESDDDATESSDSEDSQRDSSDFDSDSGGSDEDKGHRRRGKSGDKVGSGQKNLDLRALQRKVLKGESRARLEQGKLAAKVGSTSSPFDLQCKMDGLKLNDKNHTLHAEHAAWESYTATSPNKYVQRRLARSSPGHTRLDRNPNALAEMFKEDSTLALSSGASFTMTSREKSVPEQARFQRWVLWRKRELQMISRARPGALKKSEPNHQYHHEALEVIIARYVYLEAVVLSRTSESWTATWIYILQFEAKYFRVGGYGDNLSELDVRMVKALRQGKDEDQLLSDSRMRSVAEATEDPKLMVLAYAKEAELRRIAAAKAQPLAPYVTPAAKPQPFIKPPRENPKVDPPGGGGGKKAQREDLLSTAPKWNEIRRAVKDTRQKPDPVKDGHAGAWRVYKARLMQEYEVLTGAPYADGVVWQG